jgi:hypothetical protein
VESIQDVRSTVARWIGRWTEIKQNDGQVTLGVWKRLGTRACFQEIGGSLGQCTHEGRDEVKSRKKSHCKDQLVFWERQ